MDGILSEEALGILSEEALKRVGGKHGILSEEKLGVLFQ